MMTSKMNQPLRPTQHAEHILVTSILNGTYPSGSTLPNERSLAEQMGVTRPTLRETMQRLANEGWLKIQHGKATMVNNFWQEGGLSLLSTLSKYGDYLPNGFVTHLLEVRVTLLPEVASLAAQHQPTKIVAHLVHAPHPAYQSETFANYDWDLQILMARNCNNPIYLLILNDFALIFRNMALRYFKMEKARNASQTYYKDLLQAIKQKDDAIGKIVKNAMQQSIEIWHELKSISK
jgi:GntR family negative regulator for fad regulon and positive regulator of fabA